MVALIIPFLVLAGIGFVLSFVVHVMALVDYLPPGGESVFGLHIGIFVVWLPAVLVSYRLNQDQSSRTSWKQMLVGCPTWMRYAVYGLFGYAFVNFFVSMGLSASTTHTPGAGPDPSTLRAFSGHWMLFYAAAFAILYSAVRNPWRLKAAKCPAGHAVSHSDQFCPRCGVALPRNALNSPAQN